MSPPPLITEQRAVRDTAAGLALNAAGISDT